MRFEDAIALRTGRLAAVVLALVALLALGGCGDDDEPAGARSSVLPGGSWEATLEAARGQTVRWWMYGGDARVNRYVDGEVKPRAAQLGVTLRRVPIDDTASAVQRVAAERRAGRDEGGAVDLIWINGENFAQGKRDGLWLRGWAPLLPNARLLDDDPTLERDFGVPVDGQESPWSRAALVFAYDRERTPRPPRDLQALLDYAREHPGRITYPAPPDFTGSAFVRFVVQTLGEDRAFEYLRELEPLLWRGGRTHPKSEAELNRLFGDGQVDLAMSYDPAFVATAVHRGTMPRSARPLVLEGRTLQNVSFVTIPANAAHRAGALVVANLLLDPVLQAKKADPRVLGLPSVLPDDALPDTSEAPPSPYVLDDLGTPIAELPAERVPELERRWKREVRR
ncbi:MAG TPA: ABC transporter substrate-binding protein [Solirubrobacteraceae bacterium]|nr:ABC transporter substrate-binding protein [Solirubrobacteraceae bacterium]